MANDARDRIKNATHAVEDGLAIVPLGGLGEVGMNCMVYEFEGQILLVDCGINFPEQDDYGVDSIIPSFTYLLENADRVVGLMVTHGHEDHIGAIPYLLRDLNPPIYGSPLALALVARKLREHGLYEHASLNETSAGDVVNVGQFEVEFIHVNHSIPQTRSLAITTPVGTVVHTADFKVDYTSAFEDPIDLARFAQLGDDGVLALLSDSTNIEREGHTRSELAVANGLGDFIEQANGRVVVTMFASNLLRLQTLLNIAHRVGRRVVLLGRSLLQNMEVGRELGLINLPSESLLVDARQTEAFRHDQLLVLTTGSQGEPRSAMTRIAMGDHPQFKATTGDLVIFSSRVIPGNETSINRMVNHLYRKGATVRWSKHGPVHASGHACREEQKLILNLTRPRFFVPIHGEFRHLAQHAALADELGVDESFVLENGQVLGLWDDGAEVFGRVSSGRALVDGRGTDDLPSSVLQDRRKLARTGIVVVWMVLDCETGELVSGPKLFAQGVINSHRDEDLMAEAAAVARSAIDELSEESRTVPAEVAETARRAVRRVFNKHLESKPVVVPIVHEL